MHTAIPVPGTPPIATRRLDHEHALSVAAAGSHAHDFPVLVFFERGGSVGSRGEGHPAAGDLYVIAPGDVLTVDDSAALAGASGWSVYFLPEALDDAVPGALLSWRAHPLLSTFARDAGGGLLRLSVPAADRAGLVTHIRALDTELRERRDGHREAALAHLVLLLVGVARLAGDVAGDLRRGDEPLLAEVFALIERRYSGPLSLRDVARAVNLTPGHLTTTVRRRTGRSVGDWIAVRRMVQARPVADGVRAVRRGGGAVGRDARSILLRSAVPPRSRTQPPRLAPGRTRCPRLSHGPPLRSAPSGTTRRRPAASAPNSSAARRSSCSRSG